MTKFEGNQLLVGVYHAIMDETETDMLIFIHQGYFFRKIPALSASFAPKYVHLQRWSLKFGQNINGIQEQTQVDKT